jgi:ribosome recycling factor
VQKEKKITEDQLKEAEAKTRKFTDEHIKQWKKYDKKAG